MECWAHETWLTMHSAMMASVAPSAAGVHVVKTAERDSRWGEGSASLGGKKNSKYSLKLSIVVKYYECHVNFSYLISASPPAPNKQQEALPCHIPSKAAWNMTLI